MPRDSLDLENRLVGFAAQVAGLTTRIRRSVAGRHAIGQLVRCSTSAFANYAEARAAESRRDFVHKLRISLKELRETLAWLRFVELAGLHRGADLEAVRRECDELVAIFVTSVRTAERNT